jgi:hypothetical protein
MGVEIGSAAKFTRKSGRASWNFAFEVDCSRRLNIISGLAVEEVDNWCVVFSYGAKQEQSLRKLLFVSFKEEDKYE